MAKRMNKKARILWLTVCIAAAAVVFFIIVLPKLGTPQEPEDALPSVRLSVWIAYWDWENGMKDLKAIPGTPDSLQAFAASFNSSDKLFFPEGMEDMPAKLKAVQAAKPGLPVYLTIVNDTMDANGKWTDKNGGLIDRLMQSENTRTKHAADILNLVDQGGFGGVEIDYEEISGQSWLGFCDFCSRLHAALQQKGKKIRVVLEPGVKAVASLPEGPEYVVMAYNLYGTGTEPGPKADDAFIRELADKMKDIRGSKCLAFATGGYDWAPDGSAVQVTEAEAYTLSQNSQDLRRDNASGDLYFTYQKDGGIHTVWYADSQTLKGWFGLSRSLRIGNIALWRLGDARPNTLQMLGQLKEIK